MKTAELIQQCSTGGSYLGRHLVRIVRTPFDPNYSKDKEEKKLQLDAILPLFSLDLIQITEAKIIPADANGDSYVMFNGKSNLRFNLGKLSDSERGVIVDPTPEVVKKAVDNMRDGKSDIVFVNHAMALEQIKYLNEANYTRLKKFLAEMTEKARVFEKVNNHEESRFKEANEISDFSDKLGSLFGTISFLDVKVNS